MYDTLFRQTLSAQRTVKPYGSSKAGLPVACSTDASGVAILVEEVALVVAEFASRGSRRIVGHHAASHIVVRGRILLPYHTAVFSIVQGTHRLSCLQTMEHLQTLSFGEEFSHEVGVAMSQTGIPQSYAILIYRHRTIHHLVKAVAVKVCHIQGVITLCSVCAMLLAILARLAVVGVEAPFLCQLAVSPVPRLDDAVGIDTSSRNNGRQACIVKTPHTDSEGASPLPIAVAPRFRCLAIYEVVTSQFLSRLSVNDRDKLRSCAVIVVYPSRAAGVEVAPCAIVYLTVAIGITYLCAIAKDSSLASPYCHLCTTVSVKVCYGEAGRITQYDAGSTLYAP